MTNHPIDEAAGREGQPPVGHVDTEPTKGWPDRKIGILHCDVPVGAKLYANPAPKAVKLPARQELFSDTGPLDAAFVRGWNACLDAIAQRAGETG